MPAFTLTSPTFHGFLPNAHVYHDFGAGGDNRSPELRWSNPPEGTKSFIVILHDPDAPGPGGWWHWCAFDLPADTRSLAENASQDGLPGDAVQVRNSYSSNDFGGACPPPGDQAHAYHLTLYALGTDSLGLDQDASPAMVLFVADEHVLGKVGITGYYSR